MRRVHLILFFGVLNLQLGFCLKSLAQVSKSNFSNSTTTRSLSDSKEDVQSLSFFRSSFAEAKDGWAAMTMQLQKVNPQIQVGQKEIKFNNETIPIDYLFLPGSNPKDLLIINSGTHGIEAHAGSAVQLNYLQNLVNQKKINAFSILAIHGLNAFGFKYNRRVNEHNVDLNRNFVIDKKVFSEKNEGYQQVENFLNPLSKLDINFLSRFSFLANAIHMVWTYSMDTLRRAVLKGQYFSPIGIFYGGSSYESQVEIFDRILRPYTKAATRIFFVDLHTGYGERNKLHLLANDESDDGAHKLSSIFAPDTLDFGNKKNFYKVSGDITSYFLHNYKTSENEVAAVTFEYGTLDSQKAMGSIESLRRIIYENQSFHFGATEKSDIEMAKDLFLELFYPSNPQWRTSVIQQSNEKFKSIERYFSSAK